MATGSSVRNKRMVGVDNTAFIPKVKPPTGMTKAGKKLWIQLVDSIPNENFMPSDMPIMETYCETLVSFRNARKMVDEQGEVITVFDDDGNVLRSAVNPWSTVMGSAASKITALCTKLRMSPSSRMKTDVTHGKQQESVQTTALGKLING